MAAARGRIEVIARRWIIGIGVVGVALALFGCGDDDSPPASVTDDGELAQPRSAQAPSVVSTPAVCAVGERPGYFVPGPEDSRLALLGCARLGVSGKRVEFSANLARLDGELHACVNPAYSGRSQRGLYIPAICKLAPALSRFAVRDATQPRQGVRGYGYVIWGTAGISTDVAARFPGGTAQAAVFRVSSVLARRFGESAFDLFVMELPLSAACGQVVVVGDGSDAVERIPPQSALCERG